MPTISLAHLSEQHHRAVVIADNRTAELSTRDEEVLRLHEPAKADDADQPVDLLRVSTVVRRGDLWALGAHRLFCGDAFDPLSYRVLLGGERAHASSGPRRMILGNAPPRFSVTSTPDDYLQAREEQSRYGLSFSLRELLY